MLFFMPVFIHVLFDYFCNASHRFCLQFICVSLKTDEPVHLIAGQKYLKCKNIRWHMKFSLQAYEVEMYISSIFLYFFSYIFHLLLSVFFFFIFSVFFSQYIRNMCAISIRFEKNWFYLIIFRKIFPYLSLHLEP